MEILKSIWTFYTTSLIVAMLIGYSFGTYVSLTSDTNSVHRQVTDVVFTLFNGLDDNVSNKIIYTYGAAK